MTGRNDALVRADAAVPEPRERRVRSVPAPAFVLASVCSVQVGQALGKGLFGTVGGPWGVVALRLSFAAAVLLAVWRPRLPERRGDILLILAFGTAIAGMNLVYPAMRYLPLGAAVTIQLTGPLVVSLFAVRRRRDAAWGLLAVLGLVLFSDPGSARSLPLTGVVFAVASAVSMGTYLVLSRRVGARLSGGGPLALAVAWAALLSLPAGVASSGTRLVSPKPSPWAWAWPSSRRRCPTPWSSPHSGGSRPAWSVCCRAWSPWWPVWRGWPSWRRR
ncbi:EamA family transporter [Streptomyces sp. CA-132043]|uniref:EamA family transporter n=1 Tax=Streptomyces sp. CA-132043 TaxID=3240048 RepID=UPI003D8C3463